MEFTLSPEQKEKPKNQWRGYEHSLNYHLTDCLNRLIKVLSEVGVVYQPVYFQASHIVSEFIRLPGRPKNQLVVIDAYQGYKDEEEKQKFRAVIQDTFTPKEILSESDAPLASELERDGYGFLVLNNSVKKNGSSIFNRTTGEVLNTFWQALVLNSKPGRDIQFDYYTSVKLHRFTHETNAVCQGLDIEKAVNLDANVVAKILQELSLKESVFQRGKVTVDNANFPAMNLELLACRRDSQGNRYVQVVDVVVAGESIIITARKRYDGNSAGRFNFRFPTLTKALGNEAKSSFDAIYNGSFMIHHSESGAWLNSYNSGRVPTIIGNATFDNIEQHSRGKGVNRTSAPDVTPLPYYVCPTRQGQRHYVYVQDNGAEGVLFFVSKSNPANAAIDKQNRINNVLVTDKDGRRIAPMGHPLADIFFSTFTFDVLKLRESAKSSLLQKIVELHLEN